jgi:hypothetical protein
VKAILLAAIRTYWAWTPRDRRRTCLFAESCSRHVYRVTADQGLIAGLAALRQRLGRCRPGYFVLPPSPQRAEPIVILRDGSAFPLTEMAAHLGSALPP